MSLEFDSGTYFSWKDKPVGTAVEGRIVATGMVPTTDYDSGQPEFWPDGNPKMTAVITLEAPDETVWRVYAPKPSAMWAAWTKAAHATGGGKILEGGWLKTMYTGDKPSTDKKKKPQKLYESFYTPPPEGAVDPDDIL